MTLWTAAVLCSCSVFAGGSCGWELIDASQNRRFRVTFWKTREIQDFPEGCRTSLGKSRQNLLTVHTCKAYFITITFYILLTIRTPPSKSSLINRFRCLLRSCTRSIFTVLQLPTGTGAAIWKLQSFSDRTIRSATEALWLRAGKSSKSLL